MKLPRSLTARRSVIVAALTAAVAAALAAVPVAAPAASGVLLVSGVVWLDGDGDGIREAGEPPVAGHVVELAKCVWPDNGNGLSSTVDHAVTDSEGTYALRIPSWSPAEFCVVVNSDTATRVPTRFRAAGSTWSTDSDVNPRDIFSYHAFSPPVRLADPVSRRTAMDIGLVTRDLTPCYVYGSVWEDTDTDGKMEATEPRTEGFEVDLFDAGGNQLANTTTDGEGFYVFNGLPRGKYRVGFDLTGRPVGTTFTRELDPRGPLGGYNFNDIDSDVDPWTISGDPATATSRDVRLDLLCQYRAFGAGIAAPDPGTDRRITGVVSRDGNGDGNRKLEPGLSGVVVRLYRKSDGVLVGTKVTGFGGSYSFTALPLGWYVVEFDLSGRPGATFSTPNRCCFGTTYTDVDPTTIQTDPVRGRTRPQFVGNDPDVTEHIDASVQVP